MSSAVSSALVEENVSVVVELLLPDVRFVGDLSEKVTRVFVGVVLEVFPQGIFEVEKIEFISVNLFIMKFRTEREIFLDACYSDVEILSFGLIQENIC